MTGGFLSHTAVTAPAVKNFGGATSSSSYNKFNHGNSAKLSVTTKGASSARTLNPVTKPTAKPTIVSQGPSVSKTTGHTTSARLSGSHGNLFKGIRSKISSGYTQASSDNSTSDLEHRISDLEAEIANKQDTLESGDGINIDGNTINVDDNIANLPTKIEEINQDLEDLTGQIGASDITVESLQATVGVPAQGNNPATGLVGNVETLQHTINNPDKGLAKRVASLESANKTYHGNN